MWMYTFTYRYLLHVYVSFVLKEIESLEGASKTRGVSFAKNNDATPQDVRSKRSDKITSLSAIKIARSVLDPVFLEWIDYGK